MSNPLTDAADQVDSESDGLDRRKFLRRSSLLALGLGVGVVACDSGNSGMEDDEDDDDDNEPEITETFTVTVVGIGSSYPWSDQNNVGVAYAIDGEAGAEITLERGQTYEFVLEESVETGPEDFTHPFYVGETPEGQGNAEFGEGVENAHSTSGSVLFTPPASAPNSLYYVCDTHQYMGGEMTITG